LITTPFTGAAEMPDVLAKPMPADRSIAVRTVRIRISSICLIVRDCHARFDHRVPLEERGGVGLFSMPWTVFQYVDQLNLK